MQRVLPRMVCALGSIVWLACPMAADDKKLDRGAEIRKDPSQLTEWSSVVELEKKLPAEVAEGADPLRLDAATLNAAMEEAEALLFARLSVAEPA